MYGIFIIITGCLFVQLFEGTPADDRMVGITMHQAAVILANLHLGLATSQWVSESDKL